MKVYLVWEIKYAIPFPIQRLKGVYSTEGQAKKRTDELNEANLYPVEEDGYGPCGGIAYEYYENEVID